MAKQLTKLQWVIAIKKLQEMEQRDIEKATAEVAERYRKLYDHAEVAYSVAPEVDPDENWRGTPPTL